MIENQLRERLDAALADEPPLGFDPLTAADDARHATRARRGLLTGIATTAVAVAAVAVVTVTVADRGGSGPAGLGGSTGSSVADTGGPSNGPYEPGLLDGPQQFHPTGPGSDPHGLGPRAERIAERLVSRLPQVAPGVTGMRPVDFGQVTSGNYAERDDYVAGIVLFDDADGAASLVVKVSTPAAPGRGPCVTRDPGVTCRVVPRPDGSTLQVYESRDLRSVLHQRLDGSAAELTVHLSTPLDPSAPRRDTFALDEAQLTALVTDLELRL